MDPNETVTHHRLREALGKAWRERRLRKTNVAKLAGVSEATLRLFLSSPQRRLHHNTLMKIATALDVSAAYLAGLSDDPTPSTAEIEAQRDATREEINQLRAKLDRVREALAIATKAAQ